MRSPFRICTFMSAVGNKSHNLNSIRRQEGWAGKCTTVADRKGMSQSCDGCAEPEDKRIAQWALLAGRGRWDFVGAWAEHGQMEGLAQGRAAQHWGAAPPNWGESTAVRQARLGLCCNRGEENNWHLREFSPHLLLAKNAPEDLEGISQSQGKQFGLIYKVSASLWGERCCPHPHMQTPLEPDSHLPPHRLDKEKWLCTSALCPSDS